MGDRQSRMRVLQHVAVFTLDGVDEKAIGMIKRQVDKMAKVIPGIISASFSANQTDFYADYDDRRNGYNFTLLVIFRDDKAMKVYMDHDEHTAYKEIIKPYFKAIAVVDFWQDNFPEFALYGHTMMSKAGPATKSPGGFITKYCVIVVIDAYVF